MPVSMSTRNVLAILAIFMSAKSAWPQIPEQTAPPDAIETLPDVAGTDAVAKVMREFPGRGVLSDGSAPTPADVAINQFVMADGLRIELVAAEPTVSQPLSMSFDHRGRLWVVQYKQYPFPAGLKIVRYDQHLRAIFDRVPAAPPNHIPGKDCVSVFEDLDVDGHYETKRDVITGLNIATSAVADFDAIWVLNPPYLLRYPDEDGDGVPGGDPEVHLSGFGLEDTHSVANSLCWGPDGWLYAANGSTTTANVRTRANKTVAFQGQCIWRYHPKNGEFEIYAEGGGNTFSVEIDSVGRVFSGTNAGSTRGMYYPQGSYGEKNWGKHGPLTNPYAFGYFRHMRFEGDSDRFAQTFVIYDADRLPTAYQGNIIAANSLHNRVWASQLLPDTSSYRTVDLPPMVTTPDRWFRPVDVKVGPDGAVYMADWYDSRLSHVDPRDDWHKESGRIYRIDTKVASSSKKTRSWAEWLPSETHFDLAKLSSAQLLELLSHPNKFFRHTAVRTLVNRNDDSVLDQLARMARGTSEVRVGHAPARGAVSPYVPSLESLWVLEQLGQVDETLAIDLLRSENSHVRRWMVRFLGDRHAVTTNESDALKQLAVKETDVQVRSQLASSAKRIPATSGVPIIEALLTHDEDAADLHQPLLIWWAIESHCEHEHATVLGLLRDPSLWNRPIVKDVILERLMQRFAILGTEAGWQVCAELFHLAPTDQAKRPLMSGFREAFAGRTISALPDSLTKQIELYQASMQEDDLPFRLRSGDKASIDEAIGLIANSSTDRARRIELVEVISQTHPNGVEPALLRLLSDGASHSLQRVALQALSNYKDPAIGQTICLLLQSSLSPEHDVQYTAFKVLASRVPWANQLLDEVEQNRVKREQIPMDVVQQMRLHPDAQLLERVQKLWGRTQGTSEELQLEIDQLRGKLTAGRGSVEAGRVLFAQKCGVCHTLFDEGGKTGPELTGYERSNMQFMLPAIIAPSLAIREEFTSYRVLMEDGRVLTGLLDNQSPQTITLRGVDNKTVLLDREQVESLAAMDQSLMPEGLLRDLTDQQTRDLFEYLTSSTPVIQ